MEFTIGEVASGFPDRLALSISMSKTEPKTSSDLEKEILRALADQDKERGIPFLAPTRPVSDEYKMEYSEYIELFGDEISLESAFLDDIDLFGDETDEVDDVSVSAVEEAVLQPGETLDLDFDDEGLGSAYAEEDDDDEPSTFADLVENAGSSSGGIEFVPTFGFETLPDPEEESEPEIVPHFGFEMLPDPPQKAPAPEPAKTPRVEKKATPAPRKSLSKGSDVADLLESGEESVWEQVRRKPSPTRSPSRPQPRPVEVPKDLVSFIKLHQGCTIQEALQHFTAKDINRLVTLGKVMKRNGKLSI